MALLTVLLVLVALMDMRDLMAARTTKATKAGRADVALIIALRAMWDRRAFESAMWCADGRCLQGDDGHHKLPWLRLAGRALLAR